MEKLFAERIIININMAQNFYTKWQNAILADAVSQFPDSIGT